MKRFVAALTVFLAAVLGTASHGFAGAMCHSIACPPSPQTGDPFVVSAVDLADANDVGSNDVGFMAASTVAAPKGATAASLAEPQRQAQCTKNAIDQAQYKCSVRSGFPPSYSIHINVSSAFRTSALWKPALLDFMKIIYTSDNQHILQNWGSALAGALAKCSRVHACNAEVLLYFGQTNIALPPLPAVGDANWFFNSILSKISKPSFELSPANTLFTPLVNGQMCNALIAVAKADRCG